MSYSSQFSITRTSRILQAFVFSAYRKNVLSHILSGTIIYLFTKSRRKNVEISCRKSRIFFQRLIRKISRINSSQRETDPESAIRWVGLGYEWTVNEVSIPEEDFNRIRISKREEGSFLEVYELSCVCWPNNADIELHDDLILEEDDVCIGLDLNL